MKIRIKSGDCPNYLTVGKVYEVVDGYEFGSWICANDRNWIPIDISNCKHLNGGSWETVND